MIVPQIRLRARATTLILVGGIAAGLLSSAQAQRMGGPDSDTSDDLARCATTRPPTERLASVRRTTALAAPLARAAGSVAIPVYFHVLKAGTTGDLPDGVIQSQIDVLNSAYSGQTGGANTPFRFALAGVDRTDNSAWYNMKFGSPEESAAFTALHMGGAESLNIYTARPRGSTGPGAYPIGPGPGLAGILGGFSTFPWDNAGVNDGVVIHLGTVPGGSLGSRFNQGKTAVHEVGHWLGLLHTFTSGCSEPNDEVADTPQEANPFSGCGPAPDTCPFDPGPDPIDNFMDYSDDPCLFRFTPGQSARMDSMHLQYRASPVLASLVLNPTSVPGGDPSVGTLTLTKPAPTGGAAVTVWSGNPASAAVPPQGVVQVAAGETSSQPFTITTSSQFVGRGPVSIYASYGGVTTSADLNVQVPIPIVPRPVRLRAIPPRVTAGTSFAATVEMDRAAPSGGLTVNLGSNSNAVSVPLTVNVATGATSSAPFTVTTSAVSSSTLVTVTATYQSNPASGSFYLDPPLTVTGISGQGSRTLGTAITNTVTVSGGVGPYSYEFFYLYGGVWHQAQAYGPSNSWTWTPAQVGSYSMQVWVKNAGSTAAWDAYSGYSFSVTAPLVINSFTASAVNVHVGTQIAVTLSASGSIAPLQWAPFRLLNGTSTWIPNPSPPYSSVVYQGNGTTWYWTPRASDVGTWTIAAWARGSDPSKWGTWGNGEVGTSGPGQAGNLTVTVNPAPPPPVAHVIWMQPGSMAGFGGAANLVIAGSITSVPAGTVVNVIYDPWKMNVWLSAPSTTTDANGIWYTYVPNADFTDNYSVIAVSSGVQSPGCWSSPNCNRLTSCP